MMVREGLGGEGRTWGGGEGQDWVVVRVRLGGGEGRSGGWW